MSVGFDISEDISGSIVVTLLTSGKLSTALANNPETILSIVKAVLCMTLPIIAPELYALSAM